MHEEPMTVNGAFVAMHGEARGMDRAERLNKWNEIARKLVKTTYKHMIPSLEKRAKEAHERDKKEWSLELEDIEQAEDIQL